MKPQIAEILANHILELNKLLRFWLPEEFHIRRYDKSYRIIKDYFSLFTKAVTSTKRIYVADIVDYGTNIETIGKLEAVKEELDSNLKRCEVFLAGIKDIALPKGDVESDTFISDDEERQRVRRSMEEFFPNIRNEALTNLRTTRYAILTEEDSHTIDKIDVFYRWCHLYSSNLGLAELDESEKWKVEEIRGIMQEGGNIISRLITELESK